MSRTIKAVYEHGVLKPLTRLDLAEKEQVEIYIIKHDEDLPAAAIVALAEKSSSFDFLEDPAEDIYSPGDGEPL